MSYSNGAHYCGQLTFFKKVADRKDALIARYIREMSNHNLRVAIMRQDSLPIQEITRRKP
jgi:hypothetical protein